jgi:hypothetical protein
MTLAKIPTWIRIILGLSLVALGGFCGRTWYGVALFVVGAVLVGSARLQLFNEANLEFLRRREAWFHRRSESKDNAEGN